MNPILINPKIDSSASTTEQLGQMKSYLRQFKEEIELILMNIDGDNLSEKFEDNLFEGFSKRMKDSKTMSEITQTAGMIKMAVKDLEGSMASLTLTVTGIESEVYDSQGNSRITQTANAILSEVTRAEGAESGLSSRIAQTASGFSLVATNDATNTKATLTMTVTKEGGSSFSVQSNEIQFTGLVTFASLGAGGTTQIDGSRITTGTIDAARIQANAISAGSIEVLDSSSNTMFYASRSAKSVSIGGFEVDSTRIMTAQAEVSSSYPGLMLRSGVNGSTKALAIGYTAYSSYSDAKFYVNGNGKMYATDAEISGKVTATSGEIGGFTVTSSKLTTTTPSDPYHGFTLDSSGEITIAGTFVTGINSEGISTPYISVGNATAAASGAYCGMDYCDSRGTSHVVYWKSVRDAVTDGDLVLCSDY